MTPGEHEAALLEETRRYLDTYPVTVVKLRSVELVGRYPETLVRATFGYVGHDGVGHDGIIDVPVWEEPEETQRGNYNATYSVVRALIEEEATAVPWSEWH